MNGRWSKRQITTTIAVLIPWVLAFAIVIGWIPVPGMGSAEAAGQTMAVSPATNSVNVGETIEVDVNLTGATNLGGFEFDLGYDSTVMQIDRIIMGTGLNATSRTVGLLGPKTLNADTEAFGGYSYGSGSGSTGSDNGGAPMARVIMTAVGAGTSPLTLQNAHSANTTAQPVTPTLSNGTVTASAATGGTSHPVTLRAGWNLITMPALPNDISADNFANNLLSPSSNLVTIQSFECGSANPALSYYPGLGSQNTLKNMLARRGYWVKVTADTTLDIAGPVLTNGPIAVCQGWNLIAYTGSSTTPLATALSSIAGKYTAVLGFDQGAQSWYAQLPASMNTLTDLVPGHGYWLYMTEDAVLQY